MLPEDLHWLKDIFCLADAKTSKYVTVMSSGWTCPPPFPGPLSSCPVSYLPESWVCTARVGTRVYEPEKVLGELLKLWLLGMSVKNVRDT